MIVMARGLLVMLLLGSAAQAQEMRFRVPLLTVVVNPQTDKVSVQQQLVQQIRLESNFPFESMKVELGEPDSTEIVELRPGMTRDFKTWANAGWVYEASRAFFVTRSGPVTIPAVRISGETMLPGGIRQPFDVKSEPVQFEVGTPTVEMVGEPWLVANKIQISEDWSVLPDLLRAGEIATRRIEVRAEGVTGQHIGDLKMPVSLGVQVLPGKIERRTEISGDSTIGFLNQEFEVRVLSDSKTDISPVQVAWWDAAQNRMQRSAVRAYRVEPLPANVEAIVENIIRDAKVKQSRSEQTLLWLTIGSAVAVSVMSILLLLFNPVRRFVTTRVHRLADFVFGPALRLPDLGLRLRSGAGEQRKRDSANQRATHVNWEHFDERKVG